MAEDFAIGRALVIPKDVLSNLDEVDKKINKIATDSENMATKFTSAMSKMSTGTGDLLKKLTEMQTKINNMDISKFAQGVSNVAKGVSQIEKFSNAISKAAAAINKYNSSQVKKTNVDNTKEINKLNKEIEALKKKTEQLEKYRQKQQQVNKEQSSTRTNTKAIDAYNRAMASSEAIVTQRINKIAKLRQAEEMLTKASGDYSVQIKRIRQEIERLNKLNQGQVDAYGRVIKSQRNLMDTSGQLARQLALVFSVSQIEGYIMKLVKVRGEFELQNTALASILQNKDQADKLFGQITELAVKSPFTVKELTTYTKSLSAYSVEYEKLYDTTKMLADVSAGLGVDMQRLILAFGQVKAANFLRGTETRQFTEAGINMLGELAKYYTELEGRIVSVAEVQERQFKRMISFADVEEVFKRLTSAGGMFYNMQEKQAETLAGMMSNLKDSIDIMFNSMGESNEFVLKGIVNTLKTIVENWEILANIIKTSAVGFTLYVASVTKAAIANKAFAASNIEATISAGGLNKATAKIITSMKSLSAFAKANPFVLIASAVTLATFSILDHYKKVEKAKEEYDILTRSLDATKKEVENIKNSINENNRIIEENSKKVSSLSSNTDEYKKAQEELNKAQKSQSSILEELRTKFPEIYNGLVKQKDGTIDMTEAQKAYNEELERTRTLNFIMQDQESFFGDGIFEDFRDLEEAQNDYTKATNKAQDVYNATILRLEKLSATSESFAKKYKSSIEQIQKSNDSYENKLKRLRDLAPSTIFNEGYFAFSDITTALYGFSDAFTVYSDKANDANKQIDKLIENALATIGVYSEDAFKGLEDSSKQSAKRIIENFVNTIPNIKNEFIQQFVNERLNLKLGFTLDFNKETPKELSDWQKRINKYIKDNNLEIKPILATDTVDSYFGNLRDKLSELEKEQKKLQNATEQRGESGLSNKEQLKSINNEISMIEKLLIAYDELYGKEHKKGKEDNTELKRLKDQIALIKKAGEEYKKLRQYSGKEEATAKVRDSFGDAFKNLGLDITMDFDTTGIIKGLESLYKSVGDKGKKILDESLAPIRTQQEIEIKAKGVEKIQEQLDDLFAGYELSVELKKMGLDNNLISRLFDVNTFTLDDVRKNLDKLKAEIGDAGTKYEEVFQKAEKEITEMQKKELEERLKNYALNLEKSVDKISNIKVKAGVDIQYAGSLFSEGKIDANQYANILKEIIAEMNEEIGKINVNKFKESSEYIKAMGDLSLYSKNELAKLAQQIQNLISESSGKMNASDLKVYQDALDKINDRIREIDSPFKNNPFSQFGELVQIQKDFNQEKERYNEILERRNQLEIQLEQAKIELENLRRMQEQNPTQDFSSNISNAQENIQGIVSQIGSMNNQLSSSQGIMSNLSSQAGGMAGGMSSTIAMIDMIIKGVYQSINATIDLFNDFKDLMDSFGKDVDSGAWSDATKAFEALGEVNENVMSSWESFKSGDMAGASVKAVSAVFSVVKGINSLFDNKYEKRIQRQIELVENLQEAYEDLEKAIDDAYSIDTYKKANDQAIANLEAQNEALQAAIAAESRKKGGGDKDRIKEWMQQMEDNEEAIAQLIKDQISTVTAGILDDGLSAADAFVDAWLEAFQETGDGLQGLEDNFNEMLLNMIKRQAAMSIVAPLIENMQKELEKYINKDDTDLTISEAEKFAEYVKNQLPEVSAALENLFNVLKDVGLEFGDTGDTMSSLQRGITSVSEETAQALEALLSSMRFFVSDSNTVLHNIYNAIAMPTVENPFLAEMKVQSAYLSSISSLLSSVSKNVQSNGRAIKVQIV